ncbi:F-box/kelch-repeat protein At1g57790-like [Papaver somniferum]|uniref:F-box/kelch-repeat protein At1g57790-like n=1 Tax=Papaver somniferum TaxID=3469 RepID=UPI000E702E4F|nr:F-box/kelch-repeat protein At1g57790-like [Papaver somniferum]
MDNNENYFMERPLLRGAIIRFQKGGWLLMSAGARKLFFYNPFTKDTIELPDFPDYYGLSNILFTSLPTCSDCVVFGVGESDKIGGGVQVYWIARGEKYWRYQEFCNIDTYEYYMPLLNTPVLYKGILYCVDYNGLLGTFSLESRSYKVLHKPYGTFGRAYPSFLVECGGDLLLLKVEIFSFPYSVYIVSESYIAEVVFLV